MHDHWLDFILNNKLLLKRRLPPEAQQAPGVIGMKSLLKIIQCLRSKDTG